MLLLLPDIAGAVLVPQPVGMFVEPVRGVYVSDDKMIDSTGLLDHTRRTKDVVELQATLGAYHASLGEKWLELAHEAVLLGQSENAAAFFQLGLHNVRLNSGLTTKSQVGALSDWIAVLRKVGDSEALSQQLAYRYRLTGLDATVLTEEQLDFALQYFDHELAMLATSSWHNRDREILRLHDDIEDVVDRSCEGDSAQAAACLAFVKRRLYLLYLTVYAVEPYVQDQKRSLLYSPKLMADRSPTDEQLEVIERGAFLTGIRMLEDAQDFVGADDELELLLADWRWFFDRTGVAMKTFSRLAQEDPERFEQPVELPHGLIEQTSLPATASDARATFTFQVSTRGRVRNLRAVLGTEQSSVPRKLRAGIRELRFRPAVSAGGEALQVNLTKTYRETR